MGEHKPKTKTFWVNVDGEIRWSHLAALYANDHAAAAAAARSVD